MRGHSNPLGLFIDREGVHAKSMPDLIQCHMSRSTGFNLLRKDRDGAAVGRRGLNEIIVNKYVGLNNSPDLFYSSLTSFCNKF